jgi:hypothetical protein
MNDDAGRFFPRNITHYRDSLQVVKPGAESLLNSFEKSASWNQVQRLTLHYETWRGNLFEAVKSNAEIQSVPKDRMENNCLAHFDPNRRNWFRISQLATIVAIGLWKPYAKLESGANLLMYDVYWYTVQAAKMYIYNKLDRCFNWREMTRVPRINWGTLLGAQETKCTKPRGSPWLSPLRSECSWGEQAGEAGPCYQKPRVSKLTQETIRLKSTQTWWSHDGQVGGWLHKRRPHSRATFL